MSEQVSTNSHFYILPMLPKRAFQALCHSTHLYGRRLVLEWADSEVSLQALRRKTAEHFHGKCPRAPWRTVLVRTGCLMPCLLPVRAQCPPSAS